MHRLRIVLWAVVALVVAGLVVGTLLPSLGKTGPGTRTARTVCAMNLKGIGQAMAIYASQFNDQLPQIEGPFEGSWLCDIPKQPADETAKQVPGKSMDAERIASFYCPENKGQDSEKLWNGSNDYRVIGYVYFGSRAKDQGKMPEFPDTDPEKQPMSYGARMINVRFASTAVLAADWIISDKSTGGDIQWRGVRREAGGAAFDTSHVNGKIPSGQNVLFFDTSVIWKKFAGATSDKATPISQGGGGTGPYFWIQRD